MPPDLVEHTGSQEEEGFSILKDSTPERQARFSSLDELIAHHASRTETPYQPIPHKNLLVVASVNGGGKSDVEGLFPRERVYGFSDAFIPEIVEWWNRLSSDERVPYLELLATDLRERFDRKLTSWMLVPPPRISEDRRDAIYLVKSRFGPVISLYLQRARDPKHGGNAHAPIERVVHSIRGQWGVITGVRALPDWEFLFRGLGPHYRVAVLYIDAEQRQADKIRGPTERDLMKIWADFRDLYPDQFWVVDNNGRRKTFLAELKTIAGKMQLFLETA